MSGRSPAAQARARIREIAGSKWGMAASDINSRVQPKMRVDVREEFARMALMHELHAADPRSRSPRYFLTPEAAAAWVYAGKPLRPAGRPGRPLQVMAPKDRLHSIHAEGQPSPHWRGKPAQALPKNWDRKPTVCPSGRDFRYTVDELPPGHRSALDPRECRPWALAVAGGMA